MFKRILTAVILVLITFLCIYVFTNEQIKYTFEVLNELNTNNNLKEYSSSYKINEFTISNSDYYYNKLTFKEKNVYKLLFNAVINLDKKFVIDLSQDELNYEEYNICIEKAVNAFFWDHPEVYYLKTKYSIYHVKNAFINAIVTNIDYSVDSMSELLIKNQEISKKVSQIMLTLDNYTIFNNIIELHDYVAKNIDYFEYEDVNKIDSIYHNIDGAFLDNTAVCDGLSKSLQVLLNKIGIKTIFVTGMLEEESHGWIMAYIDDEWYHIDVTSDKYIKNENNKVDFVSHLYLNLTTEDILKSHSLDNPEILPVANSTKHNYYVYNEYVIDDKNNFNKTLNEIINSQKNNKYIEFMVDIADNNIPDLIINSLYNMNFNNYTSKKNNIKMKYYNHEKIYTIQN